MKRWTRIELAPPHRPCQAVHIAVKKLLLALWLAGVASGLPQMASGQMASRTLPCAHGIADAAVAPVAKEAEEPHVASLVWIPAGTFAMGNSFTNLAASGQEGYAPELPPHEVFVSSFWIGKYEVTNEELARVFQWAYEAGLVAMTNLGSNVWCAVNTEGTNAQRLVYLNLETSQIFFTNGVFAVAAGKSNFPCFHVTWHGALAYGNYLSDLDGLARAVDFDSWTTGVSAEGFRLPTEAEWEKACRGGTPGTHFPWANDAEQGTNHYMYSVDPRKANNVDFRYRTTIDGTNYLYVHQPRHPWSGEAVKTTPVGYYDGNQVVTNWYSNVWFQGAGYGQIQDMANGYGLYDMAGNVYEWCLDYMVTNWYSRAESSGPDPVATNAGISFNSYRVFRGGGWTHYWPEIYDYDPSALRCSFRASYPASSRANYIGFRVARRPTAYETWAVAAGLDPLATNGVADADFDGDTFSNDDERIAGTQPTNPASFFRVAGVGTVSNRVPLAYGAVSGRVTTVETATNLVPEGWQILATTTNAETGPAEFSAEAAGGRRFYRLRVREEP